MANLPESSTFDAGVYQLETTDPVIGGPSGVSNTPLKNLANRTKYLKDHVDALESTRAPLASPAFTGTPTAPTAAQGTNTTQLATTAFVNAEIAADMAANLATVAPAMNGAAAVGTSAKMAREDHVHPTDTSRAPLASPALTGTPTAPTAANGTNTTQIATTAFVNTAVANGGTPLDSTAANIKMNGTQSAGTATTAARADHVHPTDTSRAPIDSPSFTGAPTAQNPASSENSTRLATTAWVRAAMATIAAAAGFLISKQQNGYIVFPSWLGGLVIQWGYYAGSLDDTSATVAFPISFPTGVWNMLVSSNAGPSGYATSNFWLGTADTVSGSSFRLSGHGSGMGGAGYWWLAIGN